MAACGGDEDSDSTTSATDSGSEYEDDLKVAESGDELPPIRAMVLPMVCVFQGYACMVGPAQQKFKAELGIGQVGDMAHIFTQAAVFVHYGKMIARLGHDIIFGFLSPMMRVYVSMALVLIGTIIPPLFVFDLHERWIGFVFLSYGLSGIGLGVFECTFLAVITPLGKLTKAWAIMGIPLAFGIVNILGLLCTSRGMPIVYLYWYVVTLIPVGMFVLTRHSAGLQDSNVVVGRGRGAGVPQKGVVAACMQWNRWLYLLFPHLIGKALVNFVMENATPVNYYVYNAPKQVPLWGPAKTDNLVPHDTFFAILGLFVLMGDMLSRRVPASLSLATYSSNIAILGAAVLCSIVGFWLESFAVAVLALFGIFLAFWGNGMVYGASAKFIDNSLPKEFNLVGYSLWCFVGDLGAIVGGVTVDNIRNWICGGHEYPYECHVHN
mmetsp:Transcript_30495/g.87070  ORF Transcript_30495/g.87070 Transcript_30495/m.87070 type:complete len:436 (+) Transcript_30495:105-1412(+)